MPQKIINIGSVPNGEAGDPIRVAFKKCNENFADLFKSNITSVEVLDGSVQQPNKVLSFIIDGTVYYIPASTVK